MSLTSSYMVSWYRGCMSGPQWELSSDGTMYLEDVLSITTDDQRTFTLWRADGQDWLEHSEHVGIEAALLAGTDVWNGFA
jgi:hypothetical protein